MANNWQRWKGIMKAYPFETKRLDKWQPPYIVQPKFDGVRCRAVVEGGNVLLLSSEENVIFSVPHINLAIKRLKLDDIELDGELYHHLMPFEEIVSRTSRTTNLHPQYRAIQYHIFDTVQEDKAQTERLIELNKLSVQFERPLVSVPYWICNDFEELWQVYNELINDGYEGIIVRHISAPYERKRSLYVMKFKPKQSDEYKIVGYGEEISINGNPKGSLGFLECLSNDGETFNVGTGFSAEQRKLLWLHREKLIGKVCKVQYQHITPGRKVPRFPVFMEVVK